MPQRWRGSNVWCSTSSTIITKCTSLFNITTTFFIKFPANISNLHSPHDFKESGLFSRIRNNSKRKLLDYLCVPFEFRNLHLLALPGFKLFTSRHAERCCTTRPMVHTSNGINYLTCKLRSSPANMRTSMCAHEVLLWHTGLEPFLFSCNTKSISQWHRITFAESNKKRNTQSTDVHIRNQMKKNYETTIGKERICFITPEDYYVVYGMPEDLCNFPLLLLLSLLGKSRRLLCFVPLHLSKQQTEIRK